MDEDLRSWERLEQLFEEAVDLPREKLAAFLERETASDPELGCRLRALLEHDTNAGARIARAIGGAAQVAAAPVDWTGRYFGPYRVLREIGRGGMGQVFEAVRDDDEYRKTVAVKIAPWWCDLGLLRERFRHERQILAGLEHPNIARFLDGGTEHGVPYFAMEYVVGCPITEYARDLKLRDRLGLFLQVCSAVQYAHQNLLVHRDLKPGNILVSDEGIPKLLDFGIAKLLSPFENAGQSTITGTALWTPDYASPEQVRGRPITTRSDVYSLGLVLYELLTGERGQTADQSSPLALDYSICEAALPRPSTRAPQALRRKLAGDLDTIVGMATHKDPERRYHSVEQLGEDLERYLDGRPVVARKDSVAYRASKFLRRHWLPATAGAVAVVSLIGGVAAFAWQANLAERRFNQVRKLATGFLFDVNDKVQSKAGATAVREMVTRAAVETLGSLSRDAGRNYPLRRELAAAYLRLGAVQGATVGASRGRHHEALASFEQGLALLNGLPPSELAAAAQTEAGLLQQRGRILSSANRPVEAQADLNRALVIWRSLCRNPLREVSACQSRLEALTSVIEWNIRHSQIEPTARMVEELDQSLEALRPALSPLSYQLHWLRGQIIHSRLQWLLAGDKAAAATLLPALPVMESLVAAHPDEKEPVRLGVNYCEHLGSILLAADPLSNDPRLERVLRDGVDWTGRLLQFDTKDERTRRQAAGMVGMLGIFVARKDPLRGAALLRQAITQSAEQVRLSPSNFDTVAQLVDNADHLVRVLARVGHDQDAANDLAVVLESYDPLMGLGLKLPRTDAVRGIQALAWVTQAGVAAGRPLDPWHREAARSADSALAGSPTDPAMQAAAAVLYASLPGNSAERAQWAQRAAGLWQGLARQFPGNPKLSERARLSAVPGSLPMHDTGR
ncbi:serine/threonine-protein kinase [uncultured Paludibaculum sp.]|uniref:serine/threonine protein kinase n=1 Tax=uncultured Paludibaculum sp. TaxID=1765020 RepID=UPI002AAB8921|nr:serine/threonine-protein kinase [uncultured Paludibaculum sp.]